MNMMLIAAALAAAAPPDAPAPIAAKSVQEADGSRTLVHEVVVDAPREQVWAAISTAEGWKTWAVPVAWPTEGGGIETSYTPTASPGDSSTIRQEVLLRVPQRLMVFRTVKAPQGFPNFATYARVTSAFELEPAGAGRTRVRLTGAGYADDEAGRALLAFYERGNAASLEWLRGRFRDGPVDWAKKLAGK